MRSTTAKLSLLPSKRFCQVANWMTFKFEAPDYISRAEPTPSDETAFSVSGNLLPGTNYNTDVFYTDAYSKADTQTTETSVNINLTPFQVKQGPDDQSPKVTLLPSFTSPAVYGNLDATKITCPPSTAAASTGSYGAQMTFKLGVTTISVVKVVEQPSAYNIIVLLSAQAATVISIFAIVHNKIGELLRLYPGAENEKTPILSEQETSSGGFLDKIRNSLASADKEASGNEASSSNGSSSSAAQEDLRRTDDIELKPISH
jgi:hypothetical protein